MRWLLIGIAVIVGVALLVTAIGALLPQQHVATRQARVNAAPEIVWKLITDVDAFPTWRSDVKRVERLPDRDGRKVWAEQTSSGRITLAVDRAEPPRLLVLRIADPDLPFGGTWTYALQPDGQGTTLTITENGEVYNPVFRFMARFVFGHEATLAGYLNALEKKTSLAEPNHGL
jgi:uncharacterized protein YndB with AHSA1/START domain